LTTHGCREQRGSRESAGGVAANRASARSTFHRAPLREAAQCPRLARRAIPTGQLALSSRCAICWDSHSRRGLPIWLTRRFWLTRRSTSRARSVKGRHRSRSSAQNVATQARREAIPEALRPAASIQHGTVTASLILRKLGAFPRQNDLALALRELGSIERTIFTFKWLQEPATCPPGSTKARRATPPRAVFLSASGLGLQMRADIATVGLRPARNAAPDQVAVSADERRRHQSELVLALVDPEAIISRCSRSFCSVSAKP
jgi:hypothetical protein